MEGITNIIVPLRLHVKNCEEHRCHGRIGIDNSVIGCALCDTGCRAVDTNDTEKLETACKEFEKARLDGGLDF